MLLGHTLLKSDAKVRIFYVSTKYYLILFLNEPFTVNLIVSLLIPFFVYLQGLQRINTLALHL